MKRIKKAFSLIEVIFVIVILGIVASISSQIIVQVYENYVLQKALYNVVTKTELVANQIVNRLTYRIQGTTISKDTSKTGFVEGTDWLKLKNIPRDDNNFSTVEWIGYDNDSLSAGETPYWSGVANYITASKSSFVSLGSTFSKANLIISRLSNQEVNLTKSSPIQRPAILFSEENNYYRDSEEYTPACMGLVDPTNTDCIFRVELNSDTNLSFPDNKPKIVTERYKLAWSAYALVPVDRGNGFYDLYLHYNYQPWEHESYKDVTTYKKLLIRNISVFKFTENGGTIQFKICATENIGKDFNISTCKEKVIIR